MNKMQKIEALKAAPADIHDGEWHATNRAYGNSEHDAKITVMSDDGIVATVCTTHCGLIRAEELTVKIAALPAMLAALEEAAHTGLIESTISILRANNDDKPTTLSRQLAGWLEEVRGVIAKARG